jgi:hypothetical protein
VRGSYRTRAPVAPGLRGVSILAPSPPGWSAGVGGLHSGDSGAPARLEIGSPQLRATPAPPSRTARSRRWREASTR